MGGWPFCRLQVLSIVEWGNLVLNHCVDVTQASPSRYKTVGVEFSEKFQPIATKQREEHFLLFCGIGFVPFRKIGGGGCTSRSVGLAGLIGAVSLLWVSVGHWNPVVRVGWVPGQL